MPQSRGMEERDDALRAYYERGMERERLSDGRGDLEFTRTTEIVLRPLAVARAIERVPELTGFGPHLVGIGIGIGIG